MKNGFDIIRIKDNQKIAQNFSKHDFYRFLEKKGISWEKKLSKKLLPDDVLFVIIRKTIFIIEMKHQQCAGSVDEKLQTCDFKRKQYAKLVKDLDYFVEYVYILSDWFKKPEYKDVLNYIESVNCKYFFNTIPLEWFGFLDGK